MSEMTVSNIEVSHTPHRPTFGHARRPPGTAVHRAHQHRRCRPPRTVAPPYVRVPVPLHSDRSMRPRPCRYARLCNLLRRSPPASAPAPPLYPTLPG